LASKTYLISNQFYLEILPFLKKCNFKGKKLRKMEIIILSPQNKNNAFPTF